MNYKLRKLQKIKNNLIIVSMIFPLKILIVKKFVKVLILRALNSLEISFKFQDNYYNFITMFLLIIKLKNIMKIIKANSLINMLQLINLISSLLLVPKIMKIKQKLNQLNLKVLILLTITLIEYFWNIININLHQIYYQLFTLFQ